MRNSAAPKYLAGTSSAVKDYDLSRYEEEQRQMQPELTVRSGKEAKPTVSRLRLFVCAVLVVALTSLSIYNNVMMIELGDQLETYNSQLAQLEDETLRLQSKLEGTTSLSEVQQYASGDLAMGPVKSYQIVYVNLGEEDHVERTKNTPDHTPVYVLMQTLGGLLEYLHIG